MTTKDSRESKSGLLPVRLSVRDWLGIIGLCLTMLGAAIKVNDRLSVVETKVDLLMGIMQNRQELAARHERDGHDGHLSGVMEGE